MQPELDSRTIWFFRASLAVSIMASSIFHIARLAFIVGPSALILLLISAALCVGGIWFTERKYVLRLPSRQDVSTYLVLFCLFGGMHFWIEYNFHFRDRLFEGISSVLSLLLIFPFLMFVRGKKGKQPSEVTTP